VIPAKNGRLTLGPATMPLELAAAELANHHFWRTRRCHGRHADQREPRHQGAPAATNAPADFNGAVGNYTLKATVSTNTVAVGDPITLTIQLAGVGPIESLSLASLNNWREFKVYPPVTRVETSDPFGLQGIKTFEQVVIRKTRRSSNCRRSPSAFSTPDRRAYHSVTHPAIPIAVRASTAAPAQPTVLATGAQNQKEPKPATDIVHIKTRPGMFAQIRPPLIRQTWFVAMQGAPLLAWLTAVVWRKRTEHLATTRDSAAAVKSGN